MTLADVTSGVTTTRGSTSTPSARWSAGRPRSSRSSCRSPWSSSSTGGAACARPGCRPSSAGAVLRHRAVRRLQLHLGAADRHRRVAGLRGRRRRCCCGSGSRSSRPTSTHDEDERETVGGGQRGRPGPSAPAPGPARVARRVARDVRAGRAHRVGGRWPAAPRRRRASTAAAEVAKAYAPYVIIIAIFAVAQHRRGQGRAGREAVDDDLPLAGPGPREPGGRPAGVDDVQLQLAAGGRHPDDPRRPADHDRAQGLAGPGAAGLHGHLRRAASGRSSRSWRSWRWPT